MTIWIVNPYGRLPNEGWRDYRSTMIARALTAAGHKVVWWLTNFDHLSKAFRSPMVDGTEFFPGFSVRVLPSTPYSSHISLARVRSEANFGKAFQKEAMDAPRPDIMVVVDPSLFFSKYVLRVRQHHRAKLIVDILDLWPELFDLALPRPIRWLGKYLFAPLYWRRRHLLRQADAIFAVTRDYLAVAESIPCRIKRVAYLGVDLAQVRHCIQNSDPAALGAQFCLGAKGDEVWAIYAGSLGPNYDLDSLLDAAGELKARSPLLRLVIAGDGSLKTHIQERIQAEHLSNVSFLGSLPVDALTQLYSLCDIALSTYVQGSTVSMPVKAYDYLAAGLPIINSLGRELGQLVDQNELGINYRPQDARELTEALERLAERPDLRQKMRQNALARAAVFDSEKQHNAFLQVALELLHS
jgi:glycosyltransferase involved in cell wall biosynthesis